MSRHTDASKGETQARSGYGRIVNVGSAASFVGFPRAGVYIASKHAVHGLTQTAAIELAADTDIRVSMVVPGSVKTHNYELFTESRDEMKKGLIAGRLRAGDPVSVRRRRILQRGAAAFHRRRVYRAMTHRRRAIATRWTSACKHIA